MTLFNTKPATIETIAQSFDALVSQVTFDDVCRDCPDCALEAISQGFDSFIQLLLREDDVTNRQKRIVNNLNNQLYTAASEGNHSDPMMLVNFVNNTLYNEAQL